MTAFKNAMIIRFQDEPAMLRAHFDDVETKKPPFFIILLNPPAFISSIWRRSSSRKATGCARTGT